MAIVRLLDWSDRDKCLLLSLLLWGYMSFIFAWHLFTVNFTAFADEFLSAEGIDVMNQVMLFNQAGWIGLVIWGVLLRRSDRHSSFYPAVFMSFFAVGYLLLGWTFGLYSPMTGMVLMGSPLVGFILFGFRRVAWNFAFAVLVVLALAWLSVQGYSAHAIYFSKYPISQELLSYYWVGSTVAFMVPFIAAVITLVALLLGRWAYREAQVRDQALRDPLTRLSNRRELFCRLNHEVARARRSGRPLSVCLLDLDFFKRINDTYGHGVGDEVLVKVASVLKGNLRETDAVGRIGGEEFVLVLPETEQLGARRVVERCRTSIEASPVILADGSPLPVSASFGVVTWDPDEEADGHQLITRADEMLYRAKAGGRNRVEYCFGSVAAIVG
ncbi:GGDEF domain-containing protein [Alcanivorax sp. S6407]|uniref:GGDEF domain-containing protein n=1 Tax=Alcanivorax sp. S6407 TaxID=2926424 RepID=UPI001FF1A6E0|nr:GGDEF domain-containing protein [Alcanivorax sp. S6407]MCK0154740.1 GGDEF domain-containing protein [Alcanivorax sp. S6407]